jgi:hypothetical protein
MTDSDQGKFFLTKDGSAVSVEAACCAMRDQWTNQVAVNPGITVPSTCIASSAVLDVNYIIPPGALHYCDNMYLEMQCQNLSGTTGIFLVSSFLFIDYTTTNLGSLEVEKRFHQGERHMFTVSNSPEGQIATLNSVGISGSTYQDSLYIPPSTTVYTRIPIQSMICNAQVPLWPTNTNWQIITRIRAGQQLINDSISSIANLSIVAGSMKLIMCGRNLTSSALDVANKRLFINDNNGRSERIFRYSDMKYFQTGVSSIVSGTPFTQNFTHDGNLMFYVLSVALAAPGGGQTGGANPLTFGIPLTAIDLVRSGTVLGSQLGDNMDYTLWNQTVMQKYLKNVTPLTLNNLYMFSFSEDPLTDIKTGASHGLMPITGSTEQFRIVPGSTPAYTVALNVWGYWRSTLVIDYLTNNFKVQRYNK